MLQLRNSTCLWIVAALLLPATTWAAENEDFDAIHHTADGYYLDFLPIGKWELPRIFVVRSEESGWRVRFWRSTTAALRSGVMTAEVHQETAPADTAREVLAPSDDHASSHLDIEALIESGKHLDAHLVPALESERVILDLSMTRHLVFALLAMAFLTAVFMQLAKRYQQGIGRTSAPHGLVQNLLETLIVFVRDDIAIPNLGQNKYQRFLPFLLTAFFFILTCNLLGLVPFGGTATSNLNVTVVLAAFTFVLTQVNGSRDHWKHVFWPPNMPVPVKLLLIPTEIMGLFTKPIALAIRLFANMTAGHLVILSLIGLIFTFGQLFGSVAGYGVAPISLGLTLFVYCLELLIAFIQAYIFTILSALFIGMAIAEHSHGEAH